MDCGNHQRVFTWVLASAAAVVIWSSPLTAQDAGPIASQEDMIYCQVDGAALLADVAYPQEGRDLPAILYIHGGRWRAGSKDNKTRELNEQEWAERGFFAMTINFRLVGSTPAPAPQQDLLCAIRWLHTHAAEYGIDPNRIYLAGWSSGGHQVSLVATLGEGPYPRTGGWDDAPSDVRAVMSISAPYELNTLSWGDLWTPIAEDPVEARQLASPLNHVSQDSRPILIVHSDDDGSVPGEQALQMVEALRTAGAPHRFVHYQDRGHVALTDEVIAEMLAFIEEVERQGW